jgi:hypothetical protein
MEADRSLNLLHAKINQGVCGRFALPSRPDEIRRRFDLTKPNALILARVKSFTQSHYNHGGQQGFAVRLP